jgi:hypothetical protein
MSDLITTATAKQQVQSILNRLPDDCTLDDVQYHLYVAETLRNRLDQADGVAQVISQAEAEQRMAKWLT